MALITEKKEALSGGVNQQAAEHRLSSQVEEMINCVPTLDRGLLKRNPTTTLPLTNLDGETVTLNYNENAWSYEFDRGLSDQANTEFSFTISDYGLQIVDINSGIIYTKNNGINYEDSSESYLHSTFAGRTNYTATTIKDTVFLVNKTVNPSMEESAETDNYKTKGYIWVKRIDPIDGYTYGADVFIGDGETKVEISVGLGSAKKSAAAAATDLASRISSANSNVTATASGSMVEINSLNGYEVDGVSASDSYGNLASFGWGYKVDASSDLPDNMATFKPLVRVGRNAREAYWLEYVDGAWEESYQKGIDTIIDSTTMPHVLRQERNEATGYIEFYIREYTWDDREIGDDRTNKRPQFLLETLNTPIKDIFFFRNRMGLMTSSGVSLSEVDEYGNFFRTSVAALLDSDRIDSGIESRTAINTEYAVVFDDSVLFFSNESQFRFEGGDILSPSSFKITEITAYDVNLDIRPIAMNNRVYFISRRGDYSAVHEMVISNSSTRSSRADDITAHCQSYVDQNIDRMTTSPVNNMLFLTSRDNTDTVFVYKYYDSGTTRHQSAWFRWTFNGQIYTGFALDKNMSFMINRIGQVDGSDWIMGTGEWRMDEVWKSASPWIMTPESIDRLKNFERMPIFPQDHTLTFLDDDSTIIPAFVNFGEWVAGADGNKEIRGTLKFKTIQFSAEEGSEFGLWVEDTNRNTMREVAFKYINGRKPMVFGDAKNIKTGIIAEEEKGFRINTVSFEGDMKLRARAR